MQRRSVGVDELVDAAGELPVARLVVTARDADVRLGTVTDEVLLLCGRDAMAAPRRHWHPWLAARPPEEVEVARTTTVRWLLARGLVKRRGDRLTLRQPLSTLSWALGSATCAVTWGLELPDEPARTGGALVLPDGLALHDDVDRAHGLHHLVLRPVDVEAAWLAAIADPAACSHRTTAPEVHAGVDDVEERLRALPGIRRSRALLAAAAGAPDDPVARSVTAIGTTDGLWLVQARAGSDPGMTVQQVGPEDLLAVADGLLTLATVRS